MTQKHDEAAELSQDLGESTDLLNVELDRAEALFVQYAPPVKAWVPIGNVAGEDTLCFRKQGPSFGLFIDSADGSSCPLRKASRQQRVLAAYRLTELWERILTVTRDTVRTVEDARAVAKSAILTIKKDLDLTGD